MAIAEVEMRLTTVAAAVVAGAHTITTRIKVEKQKANCHYDHELLLKYSPSLFVIPLKTRYLSFCLQRTATARLCPRSMERHVPPEGVRNFKIASWNFGDERRNHQDKWRIVLRCREENSWEGIQEVSNNTNNNYFLNLPINTCDCLYLPQSEFR